MKNFVKVKFLLVNLFITSLLIFSCSNRVEINKHAFHSPQGIQFYDSTLEQAAMKAKKNNKPVFIMVHANWCAVCKKMKTEVLPQKELGEFYNSHFINAAVDFDSEDGKMLQKQYDVRATPTFLYLTPDGTLINKASGFLDKEKLIAAARNLKVNGKSVCE